MQICLVDKVDFKYAASLITTGRLIGVFVLLLTTPLSVLFFIVYALCCASDILNYCVEAKVSGIINFGFGTTMREGSRDYFYKKLDEHFPGMKQEYIKTFGNSYECLSPNSTRLWRIFSDVCRKNGILHKTNDVFGYMNKFESKGTQQLSLFD